MTLSDWMNIFFERSGAIQGFWNFYIVVSIGVTGFVAKAFSASTEWTPKILVASIFALFALGNWWAIDRVLDQQEHIFEIMQNEYSAELDMEGAFTELTKVTARTDIKIVHFILDALIVGIILSFPWKKRRKPL